MGFSARTSVFLGFLLFCVQLNFIAQSGDSPTELKIRQLVEKKAAYHRLTGGEQDGYQIKIHFGIDKDKALAVRSKFMSRFNEYTAHEVQYDQPNWVVLVGDYKTILEAFEVKKKIEAEFPAFIVKGKIRVRD